MNRLFIILSAILLTVSSFSVSALPGADTKGKVSAVRVLNSNHNAFYIYFSTADSDVHNCIAQGGAVKVRESGIAVTPTIYQEIYSMALTALATGKTLGLDSAGTDPCENPNIAVIYND